MFTRKNKARWLSVMGVRRNVKFYTPDAPYLKIMPLTFQRVVAEHFIEMSKSSTVGTYNRELQSIDILDGSRSTRRHEMVHAINHFASIYPSCSRHLPFQVRFIGTLMRSNINHFQAIGFILNESFAHWVEGNKTFFFKPSDSYISKAMFLSRPIGSIWALFIPIVISFFFYISICFSN